MLERMRESSSQRKAVSSLLMYRCKHSVGSNMHYHWLSDLLGTGLGLAGRQAIGLSVVLRNEKGNENENERRS